jgi:hypothetical protein
MKKGENPEKNPETLFEQISSIKNKYNSTTRKIAEEDLIATVCIACNNGQISSGCDH